MIRKPKPVVPPKKPKPLKPLPPKAKRIKPAPMPTFKGPKTDSGMGIKGNIRKVKPSKNGVQPLRSMRKK